MGLLQVVDLSKSYGEIAAVKHISLDIPSGIVFGLLGPNGAGKTTTLEMIEGLRKPDSGQILFDGLDVFANLGRVKAQIGIQLQASSFFDLLTVRETLAMFAKLYPRSVPAGPLIEQMGLADKADAQVKALSGGQRQRLAVALALINDPRIVFLDEPTAGLDPQARRSLWNSVTNLKMMGKTVVLTTHYMDEAEALCDQLAVMDHGQIIAEGTPRDLIARHLPAAIIELGPMNLPPTGLEGILRVEVDDNGLRLYTEKLDAALVNLVAWSNQSGQALMGLRTRSATLEDLFLELTGHSLRD